MSFIEIEYRRRDKEWNMADLQTHDFYEIYYLLKGERRFFIEDKIVTLSENHVVIIPPFCMHKTEGGPYQRINLYISNDLLDESEKKFLNSCPSLLSLNSDAEAKKTVLSLFYPFTKDSANNDTLLKKYSLPIAKAFLYVMQTATLTAFSFSQVSAKNNQSEKTILDVVAYINNHYRENITLDLLKNKFYISRNTLCKNFQKTMNCSVNEYCTSVRLNKSKHLLLTTNKSIEDIADLCGYSSANYFGLAFKSKTGISPTAYRKKK